MIVIMYAVGTMAKMSGVFHKHMVHYSNSGRAFIRKGSLRIYLDEVMKVA